ncbi:MAG TPA: hypothetical protein VN951_11815 [Pyrinomonadaceae bacterium]|nr:hypothetical protein [Pyrinomonadaceae bacterium]
MKTNFNRWYRAPFAATVVLMIASAPMVAQSSEESAVRAVVQQVFSQLQSHDYSSVYDSLPSSTRTRMSKPRFISALQRAQDRYVLDRIGIGKVRVAGDLAVVDTELFGRISQPFPAEGKIVVQQYLVREDGKWHVATGDNGTIQRFLKSNPSFARKFPIRPPRVYVKQNDKWVEFVGFKR